MTLLLWARYIWLAALVALVASYVWAEVSGHE
jgi:hypothetical protein